MNQPSQKIPLPWEWHHAPTLSEELASECSSGHPLHGISCTPIAIRAPYGDYLFQLNDGSSRVAAVHLTWRPETKPEYPSCEIYSGMADFFARRAWPDAACETLDRRKETPVPQIWILEDDRQRQHGFIATCEVLGVPLAVWSDAHDMLNAMSALGHHVKLISLDHDLYPENPGDPDPGTGRDISQALALRAPQCPVILHTSNSDGRRRMQGDLEGSGWTVHHVPPFGEDWIGTDWRQVVCELLAPSGN